MKLAQQLEIPLSGSGMHDALHYWADAVGENRGEVFTKPEVVEFILDLTGWRVGQNLSEKRLLEPSCGSGDFVIPAIRRLLKDNPKAKAKELSNCIRAVEVGRIAFNTLSTRVDQELAKYGFSLKDRQTLLGTWLLHADFLTQPFSHFFTHVVGNPPYLRIEALPKPLMLRYRSLFRTMYDRADIYVAFFEKGLSLLEPDGQLGYICADRWTKNRYGGPLREMIAGSFHVELYADFTGVDAFHGKVTAYPAVTIIRRGKGSHTRILNKDNIHCDVLAELSDVILNDKKDHRIKHSSTFMNGDAPWLLSNLSRRQIIQSLETSFPMIEEAGCRVGIGVATGADKVFIGSDKDLDVEDERKLPLLTRKDLKDSHIKWNGKYVLNPYDDDQPQLVNPDDYPRFKAYIESHRDQIEVRHVARKSPNSWFKTIDRIYPALTAKPKLVIPDIQGETQVAYDSGNFYPHHNLYFVLSDAWDLSALQTVLRSGLAKAFVATYSLRMRGDCLRFQAQYLRRIRIPEWSAVAPPLRNKLRDAATSTNQTTIDSTVCELYGLDEQDWNALTCD